MKQCLAVFDAMEWESPAKGLRCKTFLLSGKKVRLAEFTDTFLEVDWCTKGHAGYVLEGCLHVKMAGGELVVKAGQGFVLLEGAEHGHKGSVPTGARALVLLFEQE